MAALRPRRRSNSSRRPPYEQVTVGAERWLGAGVPTETNGKPSSTDDSTAARSADEFRPGETSAERAGRPTQVWHAASLGEREAAGMELGDGPSGPEAISGATLSRLASRPRREKTARPRRPSDGAPAWSGEGPEALSGSRPSSLHGQYRESPRPGSLSWRWPLYFLLCGLLLVLTLLRPSPVRRLAVRLLGRSTSRGIAPVPRTVLILTAVTGAFVAAAVLAEILHRSLTGMPAQPQLAADVAEPQRPSATMPGSAITAVSVGAWVVIADTDGQGLYLRRQPDWSSKWVAWREGTSLQVLATGLSGRGALPGITESWLQVRDPDGRVGYVPEQYTAVEPQT